MHIVMEKALKTVQRRNLLCPGDTVFVALSGGADSMALLYVMSDLKESLSLSGIRALHLHHGLRGTEADRDEQFVREQCGRLGIPLTVCHADVKKEAAKAHESCEQAGRRLRYRFFAEQAKAVTGAKIATAHTADDQTETVLLHMIRGTGISGLIGIPYCRENIVRPLLNCTREEIEDFCLQRQIQYVTDSTNALLCYDRNKLRHKVVPVMREINPQLNRSIEKLSVLAQEEEDYWKDQTALAIANAKRFGSSEESFDIEKLCVLPIPLLRRTLLQAARDAGASNTEYAHIDRLIGILSKGGSVNFPQRMKATSNGKSLRFISCKSTPQEQQNPEKIPLTAEIPFTFAGNTYCAHNMTIQEYGKLQNVHKNLFYFCFSCDMIGDSVYVRAKAEGDRFRPFGRNCGKTLKKFFNEMKIPPAVRSTIPIVCDEKGILLAAGIGVDERAAVTKQTTRVMWIEKTGKDCTVHVYA